MTDQSTPHGATSFRGLPPGSFLAFDGETGFPPRCEPAIEVGDSGVAKESQHVGGEGRAAAGCTKEDGASTGVKLRPVVSARRVGREFEHPPRGVDRSGNAAVLR